MFVCKICNREFIKPKGLSAHIFQEHTEYKNNLKLYYDVFVDTNQHLCKYCGNPASFISLTKGYRDTCNDKKCSKAKEKDTRLSLYGKFQSDETIKEGLIKQKETMLKRYGVRHNWVNCELREHQYKTCEILYGDKNYNNSDKMLDTKSKWSKEERELNSRHISDSLKSRSDEEKSKTNELIQSKRRAKMPEIRRKISESLQNIEDERLKEICSRRRKRIEYDGLKFDSKDEILVYQYCKRNNIEIEQNPVVLSYFDRFGKRHKYIPDFKINGQLYEVKGNQYIKDGQLFFPYRKSISDEKLKIFEARDEGKTRCMINNNVKVLLSKELKRMGVKFCLQNPVALQLAGGGQLNGDSLAADFKQDIKDIKERIDLESPTAEILVG
jgi:hypothetical protein